MRGALQRNVVCAALALVSVAIASCKTIDEKVEPYAAIFDQLEVKDDLAPLRRVVDRYSDQDARVALISFEIPYSTSEIWAKLANETLRISRNQEAYVSYAKHILVTQFHPINSVQLEYSRYYLSVQPRSEETSVVYFGLSRCLRVEGPLAASNSYVLKHYLPNRSCGGVTLDDLKQSFGMALVIGDNSNRKWSGLLNLVSADDETVRKIAIGTIGKILESINSSVPYSNYPALVRYKRERVAGPADLSLEVAFDDSTSILPNGRLDAAESGSLRILITNNGPGTAYGVSLDAVVEDPDIDIEDPKAFESIKPNETATFTLPIRASKTITSNVRRLQLKATEHRGYDSRIYVLPLETVALSSPKLEIDDIRLSKGQVLGNGRPAAVEVQVENRGLGPALKAKLRVEADAGSETIHAEQDIESILPGDTKVAIVTLDMPPDLDVAEVLMRASVVDGRGPSVSQAALEEGWTVDLAEPLLRPDWRILDGNSRGSFGDRNAILNNGERIELELRVINDGEVAAEDVYVELSVANRNIQLRNLRYEVGSLAARSISRPRIVPFTVPRGLGADGGIVLKVRLECAHFRGSTVEKFLPYRHRAPVLVVSPMQLGSISPSILEERKIGVANAGSLASEGLIVTIKPKQSYLELYSSEGKREEALQFKLGNLAPDETAELVFQLIVPRGYSSDAVSLYVNLTQQDFPDIVANLSAEVEKETPVLISREVVAENNPKKSTTDKSPPILFLQRPKDCGLVVPVAHDTIELRGRASDENGLWNVFVNDEPAEDLHDDGNFSHVVRLPIGKVTTVRVVAMDVARNSTRVVCKFMRTMPDVLERRDRALFFAVDSYDNWTDLTSPIFDAEALADVLEAKFGFETEVVKNPTLRDVESKLDSLHNERFGETDQLLIFFAGHGTALPEISDGMFITRESKCMDTRDRSCLFHSELARRIDDLPAPRILVVMDSCFSGTFGQHSRGAMVSERGDLSRGESFLRTQLAKRLRQALSAGGDSYVPDVSAGHHSPFVAQMLAFLRSWSAPEPITFTRLKASLERLEPQPLSRHFGTGKDDESAEFLFIPLNGRKRP